MKDKMLKNLMKFAKKNVTNERCEQLNEMGFGQKKYNYFDNLCIAILCGCCRGDKEYIKLLHAILNDSNIKNDVTPHVTIIDDLDCTKCNGERLLGGRESENENATKTQ